ncbi:MAG TPA: RNA polymerase sigma factor RpoD/SigA, partial [Candidatus Saccharimonadales bacterium]|nr:RNA polymerase sigma factor RpoD/SigA [Candidatus Saccharimonadales bacterium]
LTMPARKSVSRTFHEKVHQALSAAPEAGAVEVTEDLLASPDFDSAEFDDMIYAARAQGIGLRDEPRGEEEGPDEGTPFFDALQLYLRELARYPLLLPAEERGHFQALRNGREQLRPRIIEANLRLVVSMATRYRNRGVTFADLIEDGNLGLIVAVDRFDPDLGNRFSTYASWWIRQSILRGIANQARTVRIPVHVIQRINHYIAAERQLSHVLMRRPTLEEVAAKMGLAPAKAVEVVRLIEGIRSLDEVQANESMRVVAAMQVADPAPRLDELIEMQDEYRRLEEKLGQLSSREESVLRIRYGFVDGNAHTLAETGQTFGISRERARQIEKRALTKLRKLLELVERGPAGGPHKRGWVP